MTAALLLATFEVGLQIRSQLRFGQSVLNAVRGETRYVEDMRTGLKLLRPSHVFPGQDVEIRSNSLGLRSPEILPARAPGSLRIAVVGASTVMGELTPNNETTFPALLAQRLRQRYPNREVEVVNAGISGYRLEDQLRMLRKIVLPLRPDLIIVYPGFNDFADYCAEPPAPASTREGLPLLSAPGWLLSVDAIRRQTAFLRAAPPGTKSVRDAAAIDIAPYRARLERLIETVREAHVPLLLATNARAYRNDQPIEEQLRLSETARYFNRCFDLSGLHTLYDRHNAEILDAGRRFGVPVLPLHAQIPGGARYFADASHFSPDGERRAADTIFGFLISVGLLGPDRS
ncbi:MAG TPA: GDSL-type esterase/lipase family protein [Aromatoleum sp.]|uniref:SGNH/GDSL hydrolase family protein n=1 Tax=Aromatoleum sp. TaxID=2307007 RepID=UPI002B46E4D0|nr:GDSL-type esterase/lipase family protein [Aromatoleum sp.]HJV27124.1 GDSL-type esterase/lipase family protein [Aromatoleum sp.]